MSKKAKVILVCVCVLIMLFGLGVLLEPTLAGKARDAQINTRVTRLYTQVFPENKEDRLIAEEPTEEWIAEPDEPEDALHAWMREYNEELVVTAQDALQSPSDYQRTILPLEEFGLEDACIGVLSIPSIDVELPIYQGGNSANLKLGVAQLSQTSMPIGGMDTNCVIAGHRGWNGTPFLREAGNIQVGDDVYITNFWGVMHYQVTEILVILPTDVESIKIQPGRDLVSIITCHPWGKNTHRLLIRCDRVVEN